MILVTIGVQLPFDRLIRMIDDWAEHNESNNVFAQVGKSTYAPRNIDYAHFLENHDMEEQFQKCSVIVSHAGVGSILTALKHKKPLIIMPRLAKYNEHRNDHQLATAKWASKIKGVKVAFDEVELINILNNLADLEIGQLENNYASDELINNLKQIFSDKRKT